MHRLGYSHAMARNSALILAALFTGSASAEMFAPEVFSRAQQHTKTAESAENNDLHNARLIPKTEDTERASSLAHSNSNWISLPVKAQQQDQPPTPRLRF